MGLLMIAGMILMLVGLLTVLYALTPTCSHPRESTRRIQVRALDDAPLNASHVGLLFVMAVAVTIDVMKPTNLSFVLPGMAREYGLRSPITPGGTLPAALLPLSGIGGTVVGSFIWGWLGDRIGRRASLLMAAVTFIATSACGAMPMYAMNLVMCFVMGLGVGGMLPIIFTMLAETIPARHRGWLMVLIGGDVAGAYIISSTLAAVLVPRYSWRILWLIGLPTGLILVALNTWIPESPRFLLAQGRRQEAEDVMAAYGATITETEALDDESSTSISDRFLFLFQRPLLSISAVIVVLAIGVGFVTFGFQLWIPSNLQTLGLSEADANALLRNAAIVGFPLNFLVAWAYGKWSSRATIALLSGLTAAALLGFVMRGNAVVRERWLLDSLLVMPIWGISSLLAVVCAYSAELYPTLLRARTTGLIAGCCKAGGVLVIALVASGIAPPSIAATAAIGAVPLGVASLFVLVYGVETQGRRLEEIGDQLERASGASVATHRRANEPDRI
jgi:putative MFS transporter